ncbi:MAG: peptidyl-prolyl cis-trans isomerase, partial [Eubacterium sp.]|nr:peptidyl-prolyl cis-trans isomerase [Eubacterium sp.]
GFGGLYANTPLGQMVKEFEGWATNKDRSYGDVEIIKSKFGYHIMYFISDGPAYLAECKIAAQAEMEDEFVDKHKVKEYKSVMKKATVAKPQKASADDGADSPIADDSIVDDSVVDSTEPVSQP